MKSNYKIIDGHGHILPMTQQIPASIKNLGYFNITGLPGNYEFMTQDFINWKRPVSHNTFFIEPRLDWMVKHNIAHTVMITLSQLYCNLVTSDNAATDIMKFQNDFHLELQEKYPSQLSCGFVVLPRLLDKTLVEIEKRHKEGLKFICMPTHYRRDDGKYTSCTDENCQRIFSLANELGIPVQFHPYDYETVMSSLVDVDKLGAGHIVALPFLTGHLHYIFTCMGLHVRYPNVRFSFSHGNLAASYGFGRKMQWYKGRPDLFKGAQESWVRMILGENIFCDSIVHDPNNIRELKEKSSITHICHGIDSPYPLGDGVDYLNDGAYPGCILDTAEELGYITAEEKKKMFQDNIFNWLYVDDQQRQRMKEFILT